MEVKIPILALIHCLRQLDSGQSPGRWMTEKTEMHQIISKMAMSEAEKVEVTI
jgi:hypothetical protein